MATDVPGRSQTQQVPDQLWWSFVGAPLVSFSGLCYQGLNLWKETQKLFQAREILVLTKKSKADIVTGSNFLGGNANKPVLVYVDTFCSGFSSSLLYLPFIHMTEEELLLNCWLNPQRFPRNCQMHFKCVARVWMRKEKEMHHESL